MTAENFFLFIFAPKTNDRMMSIAQKKTTDDKYAMIGTAYNRLSGAVFGYILKRTGDAAEAEDLTQTVFLRLLESRWLISEDTVQSLIFTIAHNQVIDWMRRNARRQRAQEYFFIHSPKAANATDEAVETNELEEIERGCLQKMSPRRAEVYIEYIHNGKSADEIAASLDLSKRTVENHIFGARQEMKAALNTAI